MKLLPAAQKIVDRLAKVDKAKYICDKKAIELSFQKHFKELNLQCLPIIWVDNAEDGYARVWSAARSAARSAAESVARSAAWSAAQSAARLAAESASWSAAWLAAELAIRSAVWSNIKSKHKDVLKYKAIWLPFTEAFESGLWLFWVTEKEIVCCARPSLNLKGNNLHCETGPAVWWPDGKKYFYWNGVQITEAILNKKFSWKDIDNQENAEVRRVMVERYGQEKYILDSGIKPIHEDDFGTLYKKDMINDESLMVVKVVNSTPQLDGSFKDYFIRVDPKCYGGIKTAREAVASTWRKKDGNLLFKNANDYEPCMET